ncbi:MarR family winged helix-turn-helix transcriptional regulator [Youngiibacter multivorans]|uniref:DNA-binding MarR family transcriptional regulator n=1 Tax=Youngiibacter multivorans TaxID=937251 RepID=A0ABS4G899_9CLOT|nr:MarR family transcriptional regulator [Youngiibacter multivorans]MBP1920776.1 DNA-binding MarR family transcriptional regulator [Youngiibacter multivorans]
MKIDIREDNIFILSSWKFKKMYEKAFYPTTKELQLTQGEIDVLLFLFNNKPLDTAKDIAKYRSISKAMVSKSLDSLINKGYLSGETDSADKRSIHLSIEPAAVPAVEKLAQVQKSILKSIFHDITEDEYEVMKRIFSKIDSNISKKLEENGGKQKWK